MQFNSEECQRHFDNILNTMTGADGGVRFYTLLRTLLNMEELAMNGNAKANEVLNVMVRFSHLINVVNPP